MSRDEINCKDNLALALNAIVASPRTFTQRQIDLTWREALQSSDPEIFTSAAIQLDQSSREIGALILSDSRFPGQEVRYLRGIGGASGFYPMFAARPLASKALETGSSIKAIEWLQRVLSTKYADGLSISALWGVKIEGRIDLTPEFSLVPIRELPDSTQKTWVSSLSMIGADALTHSALNFETATSALIRRMRVEPFVVTPDEFAKIQKRTADEYIANQTLAEDVISILTVIGPRVTLPIAHWFTFDDADLQYASLASGARSHPFIEILPWFQSTPSELDPDEAQSVVQAFLALDAKMQDIVRTSVKRINQAQRRRNIGDKAVELCTALESLVGDGQNNEITHKVKVRATRLIGGSLNDRSRNAALLSKTYDIRSTLVHKGRVNEGRMYDIGVQRLSAKDIVNETIVLTAQVAKTLISRGSIPKWEEFDISD